MKNKYTISFLALLALSINNAFCASMEEPQTESKPSAAEHLSLAYLYYLYNPVLPSLTSRSSASIYSIKACINNPEWVRAKAREAFPDNESKQQELWAAYDWLSAFLKFSKVPDLAQQLTPATLKYINLDITRSGPTPGLSCSKTLCNGKDPSLQEEFFIDHLQHHLKRLERDEVYDPKNDTLNIPKLIEFMKHVKFWAQHGINRINGIRIPYPEKNSAVLDVEEIKRWAAEHGNTETINATNWLKKHEPHFRAKTELEQKVGLLCEKVSKLDKPLDQVITLILGIVESRPFADGNKRTAWLLAHIICSQNDLILQPLIKGTDEYKNYHHLLDDLSRSPDDNANAKNAIRDFFTKSITQCSWNPSTTLVSRQSARVIGVKKHKKRFTAFPTLFFQHPTLHEGIFFSNKQLAEALVEAQKPVNEELASMKQKSANYWECKERQEANDWLAALQHRSELLTEDDFAQSATIPLLEKINAAVLHLAGVSKIRSAMHLWNWINGGNLHWSKHTISPQELAFRFFLLVPEQRRKLIGCSVYDPDSDYIDIEELIKFFGALCHVGSRRQILGATSFSVKGKEVTFRRVNHDEIEQWAAEQNLKGKFKAEDWIKKRSFEFSEPRWISWQLEKILTLVRQEVDGFHKAFTLFLGILDLYPYVDGNKRTARLAASIILLQHGFAPLIIDSKGAELMNAYTVARKGSGEKRNLAYQLRSYCINQIKKYQAIVDHELGEVAATTEEFKKTAVDKAVEEFIAKAAAATEQEPSAEPAKTNQHVNSAETDQPVKSTGPAKDSGKKKKRKKKKKGKR